MTLRQRILKGIYPLLQGLSRLAAGKKAVLFNRKAVPPNTSFYDLKTALITGNEFSFEELKGKKVLLVNTASDCGYTAQYSELQALWEKNRGRLVVVGFPANDFREQEGSSNEAIARFCSQNYRITFPLARKSEVVKSEGQNEVFRWLTHKEQNGWNDQPPSWNFTKFLVNEKGVLTHYFHPAVSPLGKEIGEALDSAT